jgi:hypothetical protein
VLNVKIPLQLETHDRRLGFEIAGKGNSLSSGTIVDAPGGVRMEYQGSLVGKSFGIPEVLQFGVDVGVNVELGLFSAWLYDKIKNKPVERVIVRRTVITEISERNIRQVLEEETRN